MPHDEKLAERIRDILADKRGVSEKLLMGTLAFMIDGSLCCSVGRDGLLVRVSPEEREQLLESPSVSAMKLGARTMKGFLRVAPEALRTRQSLRKWLERSMAAAAARRSKPRGQRRPSAATAGRRKA